MQVEQERVDMVVNPVEVELSATVSVYQHLAWRSLEWTLGQLYV